MTKVQIAVDTASFTTDAKFRAWGQACSDALVACGLVRTADTGQINWTTVTKPTATNIKSGYEIYRFADALQASRPVFLKFEYGSGATTGGNSPGMWLTVGAGSDGAGAITGLSSVVIRSAANNGATTTNASAPAFFTHSLANGYLLACFGISLETANGSSTGTLHAGIFIVERTKDGAGASTGTGLGITYFDQVATISTPRDVGLNYLTGTGYMSAPNVHCGVASTVASMSSGTDIALYRHYIGAGGLFNAVGRLSHWTGDIVNTAQFSATPLGTTARNYYCWTGATKADSTATANIILDWLWED